MGIIEHKNHAEATEGIEKIRIPLDEQFVFVVRTRTAQLPAYKGKNKTQEIVEVAIENLGDGGTVVDFGTLLMENSVSGRSASFHLGEEDEADEDFRSVILSEKDLSNPKEIFGVLHEMGHLAADDRRGEDYVAEMDDLREKMESNKATPRDLRAIIQEERDAWAEAIKLARVIKKDYGVDLFKAFKGPDEFMGWLRETGLRTYEEALEEKGIKAYTKDEKVRAWQNSLDAAPVLPEDLGS